MKYDKKQALQIITKAAKEYREKLEDEHFLIIYQKSQGVESVQVGFRGNHFLHLTGVETRLSAQRFYERCIDGELAFSDFD